MDDSDDYPCDDIVLDDQTLAVLDQSEQKYLQERAQEAAHPIPAKQHAIKRLKTSSGWVPGTGAGFMRQEEEELPEISLQGDGSYNLNSGFRTTTQSLPRAIPLVDQSIRHNVPPRLPGQGQASHQHVQLPDTRLQNPRQVYTMNDRPRPGVQNMREISEDKSFRSGRTNIQHSAQLSQMVDLQKKLDELREENEKMKTSLKTAVDAKLAKEGEVSILRKSIEKNAQSHATQISQLKSEKEKADAKQAQMQKELRDEMERLRTEFMFRQQELEASTRKLPMSVRAKKLGRDFPSTPLAMPRAMLSWNKGGASAPNGFRKPTDESPIRSTRLPLVPKGSPTKSRKSPEKIRSGMLPGFENAFKTSMPRRSPSKRVDKDKQPMSKESSVFGPDATINLRSRLQASQGPSQFQFEPIRQQAQSREPFELPNSSGPFTVQPFPSNDEDMDVVTASSDEDIVPEEIEAINPINWKAELCRIILTHSSSLTSEISFQHLLASTHTTDKYTISCARILEVISNSDDIIDATHIIATSLLSLLTILSDAHQLLSLTILLNLMTKLVISLPKFQSILLSCQLSSQDEIGLKFVEALCVIVTKYLLPTAVHIERDELAAETLALLESLCFHTEAEFLECLEPLVRKGEVLMVLLHISQPRWLLERACRLLVLLSTYHDMYKILVYFPDDSPEVNNAVQGKDALLELLCSHLLDTDKQASESIKTYILTYIAQLSISHSATHSILGASYMLIPSLVLYISQLTSPLWEDNGSLASSSDSTSSLVQALNQATFLLYHLIFGVEPNLSLRHILQHAPHRPFHNINHVFVVTFGRLSYSEPPCWMEVRTRVELEFLAEVAREILEAVVDGPEGDSVWAAFQTEQDEDSIIDEEEMEAQLMGPGDNTNG